MISIVRELFQDRLSDRHYVPKPCVIKFGE